MGAWGAGVFENDDALDWIDEFIEERESASIVDTLELIAVADPDEREAPECSEALAAAELVAAMAGRGSAMLPEDAASWASSNPPSDASLLKLAAKAVHAVLDDSELRDLWEESDDPKEWKTAVEDLERRLKMPCG